jgi:membrane fusion protein, multidrug efflux system
MNAPKKQRRFTGFSPLFLLVLLATGCHHGPDGNGQMMPPPPEVDIVTVQPKALPLTTTLPGRIDPYRVAQVNARVDGIVLHRNFEQGSSVTNGQVLYEIDPAPYQATLDSAKASLAQAHQLMERYKPLVGINAVSKQTYDNAVSAAAQAKASEEIAEINLGYCTVTAPISGRIGAALVTEGALVSESAATPMALIQTMDPIYFDFTESSAEALKLRRELDAGQLEKASTGEPKVTLKLPDETTYPHEGKLLYQDITVDPTSGMVTLRAEFPNPEGWLLPGMFAEGRLEQAIAPKTILVPQPSVVVGPDGSASVMLVTTSTNVVVPQPIQLGSAVGTDWIVESGLKPGDRVIVNGLLKARPGGTVSPVEIKPANESTNAPAAQSGQ